VLAAIGAGLVLRYKPADTPKPPAAVVPTAEILH
jgi:hypothetical protein